MSIESTPGVCGGEPCVAGTRIHVWLLVQADKAGSSEDDILSSFPTLCSQDLTDAWAYYETHQEEIDQQIEENESA